MTVDPVIPAPALLVVAAVILTLRVVAVVPAVRAGWPGLLRWLALTVALLAVLVAATRPSVDSSAATPLAGPGENMVLVVDLSADSGAGEVGGTARIAGMRDDIDSLLRAHPDARVAVLAVTSRPGVVWPLSADTWSLRPTIAALRPDPAASPETVDAGAAATLLRYTLIAARQQYPDAAELVYYLGSGAAGSTAPQTPFDVGRVDGGGVFDYSGGAGEPTLRAVADQLGVDYVRRGPGEALPPDRVTGTDRTAADPERVELYWLAAMIAAALLLIEVFLGVRDLRALGPTRRRDRTSP